MIQIPANTVVDQVVLTHALDASFLWMQRDRASRSPNYNFRELVELDGRLQAHLRGLHLAGEAGLESYTDSLGSEAGDAFVVASVSAQLGATRFEETVDSLPDEPATTMGVASAITWLPFSVAAPLIDSWKDAEKPSRRGIAIAAAIRHRHDVGSALADAAVSEDVALRALGLWGAGELGRQDMQLQLQRSFNDDDLNCRYQARRSALLLRMPNAAAALSETLFGGGPHADEACRLAMRYMPADSSADLCAKLAEQEATIRLAVIGAGATGNPAYIPWLLQSMQRADCARVALDAIVAITGVDPEAEDMIGEEPEGFKEGPTSAPDDSDVEIPADAALPWPAPEAAEGWWQQESSRFEAGQFYLMGQTRDHAGLRHVLVHGSQSLRDVAAIELALTSEEGGCVFDTQAPTSRQSAVLASINHE